MKNPMLFVFQARTRTAHTLFSQEIVEVIRNAYGQNIRVFDTQIPHSIRAAEASAAGNSILVYDKRCRVSEAYAQLHMEKSCAEVKAVKIRELPLHEIDGFPHHPFQVRIGV